PPDRGRSPARARRREIRGRLRARGTQRRRLRDARDLRRAARRGRSAGHRPPFSQHRSGLPQHRVAAPARPRLRRTLETRLRHQQHRCDRHRREAAAPAAARRDEGRAGEVDASARRQHRVEGHDQRGQRRHRPRPRHRRPRRGAHRENMTRSFSTEGNEGRETRSFRVSVRFVSFCAILLCTGCGQHETLVDRGNRAQILYRALDVDPADLDPQTVTGIAEAKVFSAIFEPLAIIDPETLHPSPALAERWEVSPDALVYTFHLRANARWSNNEPITAQDVVDSWLRLLTPSLAADYAYQFYCIKGAEAFNKSRGRFEDVGLAAIDARTLRVTLAQPLPYFLGLLNQSCWCPLNVRAIAAISDPYQRGGRWTLP